METILAITNSVDNGIKLIACHTKEEAIEQMEIEYRNACNSAIYDYNNTYIDKDDGYAQVVEGLKQIEFRVGKLQFV